MATVQIVKAIDRRFVGWAAAALVLVFAASFLAGHGKTGAVLLIGVALLPLFVYLSLKMPIIFPFGIYIAAVPFDNILTVGGGSILTKVLGIVAGAALLLHMILLGRVRKPSRAFVLWCLSFTWMYITTLWSIDAEESQKQLVLLISQFAMVGILAFYPATAREVRWFVRIALCVAIVQGVYAGLQYLGGLVHTDGRLSLKTDNGLYLDLNIFAATMVPAAGFALTGFLYAKRFAARVLYLVPLGACAAGIVFTGSRGGLVELAVVALYVAVRSRRFLLTFLASLVPLAIIAADPLVINRFNDPTQGAASGRFFIWEAARALIVPQNRWLYGNGVGTWSSGYDRVLLGIQQFPFQGWTRASHNVFISIMTEGGIIGLGLVAAALWATFRINRAVTFDSPNFPLRLAGDAAVVSMFVTALSLDVIGFKFFWLWIAVPMLINNAFRGSPVPATAPAAPKRAASVMPMGKPPGSPALDAGLT